MITETEAEKREIENWLKEYFEKIDKNSVNLVTVLQNIQEKFRYLPKAALKAIAKMMSLTPANVFGVATFYNQFRFFPPGKHDIKVCMGTACAIKQGQLIVDQWERNLGIKVGETSEDREYSLDRVDCVGCCTLAPVTILNDKVIGDMQVTKVDGILLGHKLDREKAEREKSAKGVN